MFEVLGEFFFKVNSHLFLNLCLKFQLFGVEHYGECVIFTLHSDESPPQYFNMTHFYVLLFP